MLKKLLFADLQQQYVLSGVPNKKPTLIRLLAALFSPRFVPIVIFRLSHSLYLCKLAPLAKILSLINFIVFGLEIAVRCEIAGGLYFPHTQGTVIGANKIGCNAIIYHNVTLGARAIDLGYLEESRPTVGDNVIIGAGAKILGNIYLGDNSKVGANSVVLHDVPNDITVVGIPARSITKFVEKELLR